MSPVRSRRYSLCRWPEEANRRIPQRGHDLGTAALADATCVLPERHVPHVMRPILDRPVASWGETGTFFNHPNGWVTWRMLSSRARSVDH